jgi:uncharacterized membrane protein
MTSLWNEYTPSKRCDWIDQLRGWAVIVMIEVHCVNVWLLNELRPAWLDYVNGLVAPSFLACAGFSLTLSTYRTDGSIRPFFPEMAKRLGFILLCAYALHAPGFTLAEWTVLATPQKLLEFWKIDVLQCIVFSLLILQVLARVIRRPQVFAAVALAIAIWIPIISPYLWAEGVGDGLWMPIRGFLNGNLDRGVRSLFPLFPWLSFPAFGAFLGWCYRWARMEAHSGGWSRTSESKWLLGLLVLGVGLLAYGLHFKETWLWGGRWLQEGTVWRLHSNWGAWTWNELHSIHNTTLPSVAERLGWILLAGALMGWIEQIRRRWSGTNPIAAASQESLLLYMAHLNLIFGVLLTPTVLALTGWDWNSLGWAGTSLLTAVVITLNLAVGVWWQKVRREEALMRSLQRWALAALSVWFLAGGWWTFRYYLQSPELAREPYPFLNAARVRKGLAPTPDGLCRDPQEYFREAERKRLVIRDQARVKLMEQIQRRSPAP